MHRPRWGLGGVLAVAVAAVAFSGSAVAGNGHGNSGNAPGQQKKAEAQQAAHGNSANAPGHVKQKHAKKTASSGTAVTSHGKAKGHAKTKASSHATVSSSAQTHSSVQTQSSAPPKHSSSTAGQKVLVCHKTGSAKNPFVVISISINGWNNGHSKHDGDILLGPSTPGPHSHDASRCPTGGTTSTTTTTTTTPSTSSTTTGSTTTTTSKKPKCQQVELKGKDATGSVSFTVSKANKRGRNLVGTSVTLTVPAGAKIKAKACSGDGGALTLRDLHVKAKPTK
jgi:hypothetical protein